MVYAFDAEDPAGWHPVWRTNLDNDGLIWIMMVRLPSRERTTDLRISILPGEIGVSSTPVIDRDGRALNLPAKSKRIVRNKPHFGYQLYAVDLLTGKAKLRRSSTQSSITFPSMTKPPTSLLSRVVRRRAVVPGA
jgi:hypothetical protein